MTFTEEHYYLTVMGDAYGGSERWQFGFRARGGPASNEALVADVGPRVQLWWTGQPPFATASPASLTTHRLTEVKTAWIGTDGLYADNRVSASWFPAAPLNGTTVPSRAATLPQATLAVTLVTAKVRGLASKGRLYPPPTGFCLPEDATGTVSAANATALANSFKALINDLNSLSLFTSVAIMSRGKGVPAYDAEHNRVEYTYPNEGATENVTGVQVGRVIDTQRRRRRQLTENRQGVVL